MIKTCPECGQELHQSEAAESTAILIKNPLLKKLKRGFIVLLKPNPETYLKFHALRQKVFKIFPKDSSLLKAYISVKAR